jgi:uncharacterized phage protein gp47/JayE
MTVYGLTDEGFIPQTEPVIREGIEAELRLIRSSLPLGNRTLLGQLVAISSERYALIWELIEAVYNSTDPDAAIAAAQDAICALTGTVREPAKHSTVTLYLMGSVGTVVLSGSRASTDSGVVFETLTDVTFIACTAWVNTTAYVVGQVRTNASRAYLCITAGTSAGSGGPTTTATDITDGTVHWRYIGEGLGIIAVSAQTVDTGPLEAPAYTITQIDTPVSGWESVINALDADEGSDIETSEDLRVRRELELAQAGSTVPDAIRAALLQVANVTSVTVYYNDTDTTDGDGVPPHAVECLVRGGADQDIYDALLANVACGIKTHGTETGSATDSNGTTHVIKFSRYDEIPIYVKITLTYDAAAYPSDGDTQVKTAVVTFGDAQNGGVDAVATRIGAQAFKVAGVFDVPRSGSVGGCLISTAPAPTLDTTIVITSRQLATYDTSRITIVSSSGTP